MNVLLPLLILAVGPDAQIAQRYPEATGVYRCTFDASVDENFDQWPDQWTRRRGLGFPHYVKIQVSEEPSPVGNRCLRIDLDGGGAAAYSPPQPVGPLFSYVMEGYLKTEGLEFDRAFFSITLLNDKRHRLETFYSEKFRGTDGWKKVRLGPVSPDSDDVRWAVIGLHLEPEGRREDLTGAALFDDVWLGRLPRMSLKTSKAYNFFTGAEEVEIHCTASGFQDQSPQVTFELEDVLGENLARVQLGLTTRPAAAATELSLDSFSDEPVGLIGKTAWRPPIPGPGFYRVRATMKGRKTLLHHRELNLVVVEPRHSPAGGEFGWTLPQGNHPLPLPLLNQLIAQAGINWVKYPLWYAEEGSEELVERLIGFGERLGAQGIELIGLLHAPPEPLRSRYGKPESLSVADVFDPDPKVWYPSLEPVMTRLATRIRWWQLGADDDTSFVGHPKLIEKISRVKSELDRIGQDVNLGIGWRWLSALPGTEGGKAPWRSLALSADPPLTDQELAVYLDASAGTSLLRWVVVKPLAADTYPIEVRATDMVRRMIAAKIHGADAIFCPDPFDDNHGLMNADGTPGELFLPWRTAALVLGGAKYLDHIELPGGSHNLIFARADDAVMVVWSDQPTEEVIYLGEHVRQIDLWGRAVTPPKQGHRQVIRVGRLPTFVTGINEAITRWRMAFAFEHERIPSIFGRPHPNSFTLKNFFPRGAGGKAKLIVPEVWMVHPREVSFRLAGGEAMRHQFDVQFPYNASSGKHKVRIDFEIQAERPYQFSVYRRMDVGMGDVYIEIVTRLNKQGELEVEQRLINETDAAASFHCQLFVPGRRRLKTQIVGLGRGRDVKIYRLPEGRELLGKTLWLHAKELDGPRILNYRFVAEQ